MIMTAVRRQVFQHAEVQDYDHGNERLKNQDELALRDQIGFAGLIDQFGDFAHGAMHGRILELNVDNQPKQSAQRAENQPNFQQRVAAGAVQERDALHVGQPEIGFSGGFRRGRGRSGLLGCGASLRVHGGGNLRSWWRGLPLLGKCHGKGEC